MTNENAPAPRERQELLERCTVSTHVPQASEPELPLQSDGQELAALGSPFAALPERQLLYYGPSQLLCLKKYHLLLISRSLDEHVTVYVLLQTTYPEELFRKAFWNITIALEAYAEPSRSLRDGDARNPHGRIPNKDLIYRETLDDCSHPVVVFRQDGSGEDHDGPGGLGAAWKFTAFIGED